MQQDILINYSPQESRVAIVENGAVQEIHIERTLERGLVSNIYLGRVSRVLPGMQSAFIDIGLERAAFLHVADVWRRPDPAAQARPSPNSTPSAPAPSSATPDDSATPDSATPPEAPAAPPDPCPEHPGTAPAAAPAAAANAAACNATQTSASDPAPVEASAPLPPMRAGGRGPRPGPVPIEHQIFEGQALMVQVIKDPIGAKGARLSTQISIAGRLLVFLPQDEHIGVSQKIPAPEREALRSRVRSLADAAGAKGGFILRTNGEDASDEELAEDIAYLRTTWQRIRELATKMPAPSVLHQDLDLMQRVLRDMAVERTQSILIDSREQHARLLAFGQEFMPRAAQKLRHYQGEQPIFDLFAIDEEITRALGRRVELKSGGYLIIDQTEAMTTIDVNTGAFVGARNFEDTIFKTNLEAAQAIARQLRLRNLGGIIIVDFIDMAHPPHREQVLAELRRQLARDRVKTAAGHFSALGLLEMTRKRTRESLAQLLCQPCPACQGRGHIKTQRSVCYEILREILRESRQFNPAEFRIVAHPEVIELLLGEESQHLASLSDFIGKPIALQPEASLAPDAYDIVLP